MGMIQQFSEGNFGLADTFSSYNYEPLLTHTALFISVLIILCVTWMAKALRKTTFQFPLPPGPRGLPVLGYIPFIGTHLHITFAKLAKQYGPIYKVWLGNKLCVVVSSPAIVKEIVRDKDTIFGNRSASIAVLIATYGGSNIAFADYGPHWHKMRKLLVKEMLGNASVDACYEERREGVHTGIKQVYRNIGKPVDIGLILLLTLADIVFRMVWGGSVFDNNRVEGSNLRDILAETMVLLASPNLSDFFPALAWLDLQSVARRMRNVSCRFDIILEQAIYDCRESSRSISGNKKGRRVLLHNLLELEDKGNSSSALSLIQLKGLLKDIVLGGTDSTATIVEWAIAELLRHPDILKLVYEELTQVVGLDTRVEESHLPKLQYLKAVLKETHRLHPAFPLLVPRRPSQTTDIGGYTIPKDTQIFINVWAIHRDEKLWERPLEFRPERFLNSEDKWDYGGNDLRYLPFGSGRRACAGIPMAERMQIWYCAEESSSSCCCSISKVVQLGALCVRKVILHFSSTGFGKLLEYDSAIIGDSTQFGGWYMLC